ncbi:MAG: hypothetical protein FJ261_15810, partial [Planctomycetes bacterium]|nr:hypothetical protein [Planctomycetota bacterium]
SAFTISGGGVDSPSPASSTTAPVVNTVTWNFAIDNALAQYLGAGQTVTATYRITVVDNSISVTGNESSTSSQDVTITLTGTNDAPTITVQTGNSNSAALTETNAGLSTSGTLTVRDLDLANTVAVAVQSVAASGTTTGLVPTNAQLLAMLSLSPASTTNILTNTEVVDQLSWSFNSGAEAFNYLAVGETLTLTYTLRSTDSSGATGDRSITLTIAGTNDGPTTTAVDVSGTITETTKLTDSGSLTFADLDATNRPTAAEATTSITALRADGVTAFALTTAQQQKLEDAFSISLASGATNNGTVNWAYTVVESDLNFLAASETVTAVFTVTVTDNAGATSTKDVTVTLTGTNDAPTRLVASVPLPALAEDTTAEATVAQLFNGTGSNAAYADLDNSGLGDPFAGVVLVANAATSTQGNWQYKAPSGSWTNVSSSGSPLSLTSALFLPYDYSLRFQPAANWNGNAGSLTARLADGLLSVHSSGGSRFNLSTAGSGGTTRYSDSSNAVTLTATVSAVNDAPMVSLATATLAAITEDNTNPAGASVASFVAASFSDATDAISGGSSANTFAGIAITAYSADPAAGIWQYSSDSGSTWLEISAVAGSATAISLRASDWIRFLPAQHFNGSAPSLDVVLIDSSTTVTTAAVIDASSRGGTSAFSTGTVVISHSISAVNDAPTLNPPATFNLVEDTTGNLVFNANTFADVDAGSGFIRATLSIADGYLQIASANLGGVSLDSSSTPTNRIFTGTVASLNNFFSTAGNIKYTPALNNDTQRTLTLSVSDQGNTGSGGALTASATSTILVQAVSDDPTITSPNVIKIDLSNAGNSDGGSLSDWNTLNNGGSSSSVKRHSDGNT